MLEYVVSAKLFNRLNLKFVFKHIGLMQQKLHQLYHIAVFTHLQ